MSRLSAKLRGVMAFDGSKQIGLMYWCPGCEGPHMVNTAVEGEPNWTWDGNAEAPTLSPSILCFTSYHREGDRLVKGERRTLCHHFVKAGKIEFCPDSPHKLSGQTVDLPDWPYAEGEYGGA